jgi:Flp pilus assembly pilin Flp
MCASPVKVNRASPRTRITQSGDCRFQSRDESSAYCHCTERAAAFPTIRRNDLFRKAACFDKSRFVPSDRKEVNPLISDFFRRLHINALTLREENGQTMAEYGVVLAVITIGVVVVLTSLAGGIKNALNAVIDVLPK